MFGLIFIWDVLVGIESIALILFLAQQKKPSRITPQKLDAHLTLCFKRKQIRKNKIKHKNSMEPLHMY